ncbi:MAG: hypothetical protein ACFE85_01810 [Candidatus Hodarchaeota archaeon]
MDQDENEYDELDDLLEKEWEKQDQIHRKCKMKDDTSLKQKKWKEKYS